MTSSDYLIKKVFRSYLATAAFSTLAVSLGITLDCLIAGNLLGVDALAAQGIASPLVGLISAVAGVLSYGAIAVCNILIGKEQGERVNPIFSMTITATAAVGLILSLICCLCGTQIAVIMGAKGTLIPLAADYIRGLGLGVIPIALSMYLTSLVKMDGSKNLAFYSIIVMSTVNVLLDLLFVGPMKMGMFGLALATVLGYTASLLVCFTHFLNKRGTLRLVFKGWNSRSMGEVMTMGTPTALNSVTQVLRIMALNHLLMSIGGIVAVMAMTVQSSVYFLLSAAPLGVGQALNYIVGLFFGEEDYRSLSKTLRLAMKTGIAICAVMGCVVFIFAAPIARVFGLFDGEGISMATTALRFLCICLSFALVNDALISFYQSTNNPVMANLVCLGHNLVFVVITAYALSPLLGVTAVWLSAILGELLTIMMIYMIACFKNKRFPIRLDSVMMLPKRFGGDTIEVKEFSIGNSFDEALSASGEIHHFCLRNGVDKRLSYLTALCVEEMAGNVIRHGFTQDKKQFLDIRVLKTADGLIFRMRDDGAPFNPIEYDRYHENHDAAACIGIRLIRGMAADIHYRHTLAMNNLILRFDTNCSG